MRAILKRSLFSEVSETRNLWVYSIDALLEGEEEEEGSEEEIEDEDEVEDEDADADADAADEIKNANKSIIQINDEGSEEKGWCFEIGLIDQLHMHFSVKNANPGIGDDICGKL